jgi:nucleotide-binding universal stress UspA family protein
MDQSEGTYRIVVGVDLGETGDTALGEAFRIARDHPNDEVHAVCVLKGVGAHPSATELDALADRMNDVLESLKERVHLVSEREFPGEQWDQETGFHVRLGDAADAIHQVAVDLDADIIVVGTHQRTGVAKLVLGSVAEKLLHMARLPVLVAQRKNFSGMRPSERPDAPRAKASDYVYQRERLRFGRRGGHIAGLV